MASFIGVKMDRKFRIRTMRAAYFLLVSTIKDGDFSVYARGDSQKTNDC